MQSSLLKPPWLRIKLHFGPATLTKPNHGPSKPVGDPREVRLTKLCPYRLKDIEGHIFEVVMCGRALSAELFEGVANFAQRIIKLFLRQFNRYWPYDALCQIRHFGLQVEGCIHHFRSLPMCGLLPYPVLIRLALTVLWLPALPAPYPPLRCQLGIPPAAPSLQRVSIPRQSR